MVRYSRGRALWEIGAAELACASMPARGSFYLLHHPEPRGDGDG